MRQGMNLVPVIGLLMLFSCQSTDLAKIREGWKNEIRSAENSFAEMAASEGMEKAFVTYAAPDAVLMRNNLLIKGVDQIQQFFANQKSHGNSTLTWSPDFVDVSNSGDLGYTYGNYKYQGIDSAGQIFESNGIFHTVWKRQSDGSWRFVWD